jgi:excisionase family DNA binding protein
VIVLGYNGDKKGDGYGMLTTKKVSDILQVSEETVRRWIRNGELEAFRSGKTYKIDQASLNELIKSKSKEPGNSIFKRAVLLDGMGSDGTDSDTITAKLIGTEAAVIAKNVSTWLPFDQMLDAPEEMSPFQIDHLISIGKIEMRILDFDYQKEKILLEHKYQPKLLEKEKEIAVLKILREKRLKELGYGQ